MNYYRHRRGSYTLAEPSRFPRLLKLAIGAGLLAFVLWFVGSWILGVIGGGGSIRETAVVLTIEQRGSVQVSLEGKDFAPGQNALKLYTGDRVKTGPTANAAIRFFDGTVLRLGGDTQLTIQKSDLSSKSPSAIAVKLAAGTAWISTPTSLVYSGAILRTVKSDAVSYDIPSRTDALLTPSAVTVYSADGLGIRVTVPKDAIPVIVGEGQMFTLPVTYGANDDLYQYRSPVDVASVTPFLAESRSLYTAVPGVSAEATAPSNLSGATLLLISPKERASVVGGTVVVEGKVAPVVTSLRINGIKIDTMNGGDFSQEISLGSAETEVRVQAFSAAGEVVAEQLRTIVRSQAKAGLPTIATPAKEGQTYRTSDAEFVLRGTAPADAQGIMVNDYKLQLFTPGSTTWSYLASIRLQNLKEGENIFQVRSIDAAGRQSDPVSVTIIVSNDGPEGVVTNPSSGGSVSSTPATPAELPKNAPLQPGSLTVTAPAAGLAFTATGSEFLIEGTTVSATASVWVNDYKLQLYTPGKTFWNYIASSNLLTLKRGTNKYHVVTRDKQNMILDELTYVVTY